MDFSTTGLAKYNWFLVMIYVKVTIVASLLMDIAKAFDKVPHNRLKHKLQWYGVTGNTYQWISSFLRDRYQRATIDNVSSDLVAVTSGVPQGTCWVPYCLLSISTMLLII